MNTDTQPIDDNAAYHADKSRIGKSGLDLVHRSPAHYYAKYLDPDRERDKPTPALAMGSATHKALFEKDTFLETYIVMDDTKICQEIGGKAPRQTNRYKDWLSDFQNKNGNKTIIDAADFRTCIAIRNAVASHPAAAILLEKGVPEQRIDWAWQGDNSAGNPIQVKCKSKLDWQSHNGFIVDLKTTEDASPTEFAKSAYNYRYHVQAAFYLEAYYQKYGEPARGFIFIAAEKKPPYAVALYYATPDMINLGRREYEADLRVYHDCLVTGEFPSFGTEIKQLVLPAWAYRQ